METTSIAHRPYLRLPSDSTDRFPVKFHLGVGDLRISGRPRKCFGRLTSRFSDSGHQQYYVLSRSVTKKKEKEKSSEIKSVKSKLKLIERLSSDLSSFSLVANGKETGNNSIDESKISDAVELLQAQLQQLRTEQKDLKKKMKEEKARIKQSKCKSDSSSSSSSESSDSECGEVIDMSRLRSNNGEAQKVLQVPPLASLVQQDKTEEVVPKEVLCLQNPGESCCGSSKGCSNDQSNSINDATSSKRIEICMGGKCKKSGAEALLEEFQSKVGAEGAVLGCKCMGKCKTAPNLRVEVQATTMPSIDSSICIGVGLRDVDAILANFFAQDGDAKFLMAPS
ncbi:hypothetical protein Dsin_025719 [Dipteronia sinensis]|uniref:Diacylglycerol acyltransferase 3 n=1 Tax=Dipteronia sinensis TaxID=43782 RepID=A0AAD9ZWQ1_9ROSI|nr:hypothetical protein Dsin_025719 [Dipteronia sinensis]